MQLGDGRHSPAIVTKISTISILCEGTERECEPTVTKSLSQLLDEFALVRSENLQELPAMNLQPRDLERRGRHRAPGVVTLSQLLATWAAHALTHLHQISRIMTYQYREAVGPWEKYLGVLAPATTPNCEQNQLDDLP
jgi:hypothetical protein